MIETATVSDPPLQPWSHRDRSGAWCHTGTFMPAEGTCGKRCTKCGQWVPGSWPEEPPPAEEHAGADRLLAALYHAQRSAVLGSCDGPIALADYCDLLSRVRDAVVASHAAWVGWLLRGNPRTLDRSLYPLVDVLLPILGTYRTPEEQRELEEAAR